LILGCTHYPFLEPIIREAAGAGIALIDTGAAVARQLHRRLHAELPDRAPGARSAAEFWSSGDAQQASRTISALWGETVTVQSLPSSYR
jgi:glutamate racemase